MTESEQSQAAPHAGRPRFSLRGLFLFVLVAGVASSHAVTSRRLKQIKAKLTNANEELGEAYEELRDLESQNQELGFQLADFQVEEPNRLCVVASPFLRLKDLRRRWQVVAPDSNYRLCAAVKDIPDEGVPIHGAQVLVPHLPKGECSIEARVRQNNSGEWQLHAECISVDSRFPTFDSVGSDISISKSLGDALAQSDCPLISLTKNSFTRVDYVDGPVELLRHAPSRHNRQNEGSSAQELGEGIILWIEKNQPAPDSALPPAPP